MNISELRADDDTDIRIEELMMIQISRLRMYNAKARGSFITIFSRIQISPYTG